MTSTTIRVSNEKLVFTTNKIIKVDEYRTPALVSKKKWALENKDNLPPLWHDDYNFIVDSIYQEHLVNSKFKVEQYQQDILLSDAKAMRNAFFSQIQVTLQTTPIKGDVCLVLRTNDGDEVSLCSLKSFEKPFEPLQHFTDQQVDFAKPLNQRITSFCLPVGQRLILRVRGGILVNGNILVCTKYM
jgi:hypothetical protein